MWTKAQKTVIWIAAVVAVVLFVLGYWVSTKAAAQVPPLPTQLAVWLPVDVAAAEVSPAGSLLVTLSSEEFKQRFPTGGLVSFPQKPDDGTRLGMKGPVVTVWHVEGGKLYRAVQDIKHPSSWPSTFAIGSLRLEDGAIVASPENSLDRVVTLFYVPAIVLALFAMAVFAPFAFGKKRDNPVVRPT